MLKYKISQSALYVWSKCTEDHLVCFQLLMHWLVTWRCSLVHYSLVHEPKNNWSHSSALRDTDIFSLSTIVITFAGSQCLLRSILFVFTLFSGESIQNWVYSHGCLLTNRSTVLSHLPKNCKFQGKLEMLMSQGHISQSKHLARQSIR